MKTERIVLKRVGHIVDVFFGEQGFAPQNWTRFIVVRGFLKFIKGAQLSAHDFNAVKGRLGL
jgi:hypothetical protein